MHRPGMLSIWFFVGVLLLSYGILIMGAGFYYSPEDHPVVLGELRINIWWGALLLILGIIYTLKFRPGKG